ncbi:hypothetical protein GCM10022242_31420 [Nocardioides panacisoli]|uniref:ATP-binding protein n=1 Tax=Nocardioides panacisoli TaxID=627624 RepID=A0ABP7IVM7_9ACTN
MPHRETLTVGAGPRSVQDARRWAADVCARLGHPELEECARLGVSELVTNAVLHGKPPVTLVVRGTADHPRFEVSDGSRVAPQRSSRAGGIDLDAFDLDAWDSSSPDKIDVAGLTSFGRGLDIVARASVAWGTEIEEDGKTVWFEPAAELQDGRGAPYELVEPPPVDTDGRTRIGEIAIQVNGVPVEAFGQFQRHFRDLRREIRLLAMGQEGEYPLAREFSLHFDALEQPLRTNMGREQVDHAREAGAGTIDLRLRMPPETARQIGGLVDLLDAADDFSRAERLLTPPRTREQRSFQIWFLGEFRRQSAGAPPLSWSGDGELLADA